LGLTQQALQLPNGLAWRFQSVAQNISPSWITRCPSNSDSVGSLEFSQLTIMKIGLSLMDIDGL